MNVKLPHISNHLNGRRNPGTDRFRSFLLSLLVFGLATNFAGLAWAQSGEPEFKSDIPKLDMTVPRSTTLKGGVLHQESQTLPKANLKGSADGGQSSSKASKFKLFSGKAKTDRQRALNAQAQNGAPLNAGLQSGIGIIGVKFVLSFGRPPVINRVFPGTPAYSVGLRNGDIIVAVDGYPTFGLSKDDVYAMIVGTPGTPVTVTLGRNGDYLPRTMLRMDFNDITDPQTRRDYMNM